MANTMKKEFELTNKAYITIMDIPVFENTTGTPVFIKLKNYGKIPAEIIKAYTGNDNEIKTADIRTKQILYPGEESTFITGNSSQKITQDSKTEAVIEYITPGIKEEKEVVKYKIIFELSDDNNYINPIWTQIK